MKSSYTNVFLTRESMIVEIHFGGGVTSFLTPAPTYDPG